MARRQALSLEDAEKLGIAALALLAEEPERLVRFLALTGVEPHRIRQEAAKPAFLAELLAHVQEDESLLLVLATAAGKAPEEIATAESILRTAVP